MSFFGRWTTPLLAAMMLVAAGGCSQMDSGQVDEEKEPHYVLGKSRVNAMDYQGAIEAFEEALEANPHSAQAHYQLAILYDNQDSVADPAAAIYHYQQSLKYDPKFQNADAIQGRIDTCKQKLAENVLQLPSSPATQQQLEKLTEENRRLHDQLTQWQNYYAAQQAAAKTNPPTPQYGYGYTPQQPAYAIQQPVTSPTPEDVTLQSGTPASPVTHATGTSTGTSSGAHTSPGTTPNSRRTSDARTSRSHIHVVMSGETFAGIARKQGVSLVALEEANPHVNPGKIRAGQVLNLPPP
jgi:LysM repeat protein